MAQGPHWDAQGAKVVPLDSHRCPKGWVRGPFRRPMGFIGSLRGPFGQPRALWAAKGPLRGGKGAPYGWLKDGPGAHGIADQGASLGDLGVFSRPRGAPTGG